MAPQNISQAEFEAATELRSVEFPRMWEQYREKADTHKKFTVFTYHKDDSSGHPYGVVQKDYAVDKNDIETSVIDILKRYRQGMVQHPMAWLRDQPPPAANTVGSNGDGNQVVVKTYTRVRFSDAVV
ncbi:hypothetical protein H4219_004141 [Mycoemilia scoparia]|uniref:Uncharacterized protein n=1 Tax=Mycoemilia scoparia TaxID=417184 RepID=A0A9W8DSB1_9FUNG|nr:hypothetical protein H4219_004141 [Mycoemilia scoparia]